MVACAYNKSVDEHPTETIMDNIEAAGWTVVVLCPLAMIANAALSFAALG